jgi:hypothetical protein
MCALTECSRLDSEVTTTAPHGEEAISLRKTPKSCGTNRAPQHSRDCSLISVKINTEELGDNVLVR